MARLSIDPNLTRGHDAVFEQQVRSTHAGQAYFANTGPFGATCGQCALYGYWRQHRNQNGDAVKTTHRDGACRKFHERTGKHGPAVPASAAACRYFEPKERA